MFYISTLTQAVTNYNSQINNLQKQRETLSRDIMRNQQLAEEKKQEAARINTEIKKIEGDISVTQNRINILEGQINEVRGQIDEKTIAIRGKEEDIKRERANQAEAIRAIYESTDESFVYLLFSSKNLSEVIDRTSYLEALEAKIDKTIRNITSLRDYLLKEKEELSKKEVELDSLKKQQEAYRKGLAYQKQQKDDLYTDARSAQKKYEELLEIARKAYQDVNSELYRVTQAAKRKAQTGGSKKVGNIEFSWPFSGTITAGFGVPTPVQSFHTGIDIDGVIGDPILAAADGKVVATAGNSTWGYGYYVTIDHGSGLTTLYAHLSGFDVGVGQEVERGERIGFMGNTGFAIAFAGGDGSHLHFEAREDGVPVNPYLYLP